MVNVFLYIIQQLSTYMVNVFLVNENATKNIKHGSLNMVNIIGHGRSVQEQVAHNMVLVPQYTLTVSQDMVNIHRTC
jgi:hypothetical protein